MAHGEHDYGSVFQNGHGEDRDSEKDDVQDDVEQNDEFQPDKVCTCRYYQFLELVIEIWREFSS